MKLVKVYKKNKEIFYLRLFGVRIEIQKKVVPHIFCFFFIMNIKRLLDNYFYALMVIIYIYINEDMDFASSFFGKRIIEIKASYIYIVNLKKIYIYIAQ